MNLIIDKGNTYTKIAVIDGKEVVKEWHQSHFDTAFVEVIIAMYNIQKAIICSTAGIDNVTEVVKELLPNTLTLCGTTKLPIKVNYDSTTTLGADRIAFAVGAITEYGYKDMLLIGMGTAITIDLIKDGQYCGGNISLGVEMRFQALHHFTAALPLCDIDDTIIGKAIIGNTTTKAIQAGVMNGLYYEIKGYIDYYTSINPQIKIIFTGGSAKNYANQIKNAIFADCKVMYEGLNTILEYNATTNYK